MSVEAKILELILNNLDKEFVNSLSNNFDIDDVNLVDDLYYDSIKLIQLITNLEEFFKIKIDDDMLLMENFSTVKQIKETILNLVNILE
jgi:acyl carrier protein